MGTFCGTMSTAGLTRDLGLKLSSGGPRVHESVTVLRGGAMVKLGRERELSGPVSRKAIEARQKKGVRVSSTSKRRL